MVKLLNATGVIQILQIQLTKFELLKRYLRNTDQTDIIEMQMGDS